MGRTLPCGVFVLGRMAAEADTGRHGQRELVCWCLVGWPLVTGKQGVGPSVEAVAMAAWLGEAAAATLLRLTGDLAALLWVLECGRPARCLTGCGCHSVVGGRNVVATALWVMECGCHGILGRRVWVVMVAE